MSESSNDKARRLFRPGITLETLEANGIITATAEEARELTGIRRKGLSIPYMDLWGDPIRDGEREFCRIRLDVPLKDMKYHQRKGSGNHLYLPNGLHRLLDETEELVVVEGEFKALALVESGVPAVGISGFYGFGNDRSPAPELESICDEYPNLSRILFLGDSDTALNYQFSDAAKKLEKRFGDEDVIRLPRMSIAGPKGIDDFKQTLLDESEDREIGQEAFKEEWKKMVRSSVPVKEHSSARELSMALFRREKDVLRGLRDERKTWALGKMAMLAAFVKEPAAVEIKELALEMGVGKRDFDRMVKEAKEKRKFERSTSSNAFEPATSGAWYEAGKRHFWIPDSKNQLIPLDEKSTRRWLVERGLSKKVPEESDQSPLDKALLSLQMERNVDAALELAGHRIGVVECSGKRILVTREANPIEAKEGDWELIRGVVEAQFLGEDESWVQVEIFYEWCRIFLECLENEHSNSNGQALIIAGPPDCGKSLLQNLLTDLFGGRVALPFQFASGKTAFNADLAGAEHLMIEDEDANDDPSARRRTGAILKQYAANKMTRVHPKGKDAYVVELLNRLTITMNDDPKSLGILPPIDKGLADKLIILKAHKRTLPRTPKNDEERVAFPRDLRAQLPAFKHYLLHEFECSPELKDRRFGVIAFQDPELRSRIDGIATEERFLSLVECLLGTLRPIAETESPKSYAAAELAGMLIGEDFACREEARLLLGAHEKAKAAVSVGTFMGILKSKRPQLISGRRTASTREWVMNPERAELEAIMPEAIEIEDQKVISDTHDTLSGGSETTNNI